MSGVIKLNNKENNTMYIKITKQLAVGAEYYETSRSWGHKAHLYLGRTENGNGNLILKEKVRYYNRTWESYKFETVLKNLYFEAKKKNLLSAYHLRLFKKMIDNGGKVEAKRIKQEFKTVAMVASLGSIFGKTQKESNDWKARMIKAGLGSKGLIMPDDWDELDEDTKQTRLDAIIKMMEA